MDQVTARPTTFVVDGLIPDEDLTVLVGEEGVGKGLWLCFQIAAITRAGGHVLMVSTEDDTERELRPRLDVAGADLSRVHMMAAHSNGSGGQPTFPEDRREVREVVSKHAVRLIVVDPWVSSVSGDLRLRDTQQARRALDPLSALARESKAAVVAVVHPNRGEGSLRDRVGLTAALRQAARVLIYAIEDPDDDTRFFVGVEKANGLYRRKASEFTKQVVPHAVAETIGRCHLQGTSERTIREWDLYFARQSDRRTSRDVRWSEVAKVAETSSESVLTRADVVTVYETTGSSAKAADKAISTWKDAGRLVPTETPGHYRVGEAS